MVFSFYHTWIMRAFDRQSAAIHDAPIPTWGVGARICGLLVAVCFFIRFTDMRWRDCRLLFASEEHTEKIMNLFGAYDDGYRSYREYEFAQWLRQRELPKIPALPAGQPVLSLPEGRESFLAREVDRIWNSANAGCGQWFELFEVRYLGGLRALQSRLLPYDLVIFQSLVQDRGIDLSDEHYDAACQAESEVIDEIRAGYDCD